MPTTAVLLAAGNGSRFDGPGHKLAAPWGATTVLGAALDNVLGADFGEVLVVVGEPTSLPDLASDQRVTIIVNDLWSEGQSTSLRAAVAEATRRGATDIVVGLADQPAVPAAAWRAVAASTAPIVVARYHRRVVEQSGGTDMASTRSAPPVRLDASVWSMLPESGDFGARHLIADHPELVEYVDVEGDDRDIDTMADLLNDDDRAYVEWALGRTPRCEYTIAARLPDGRPTVIANPPFLSDGTPMPTRYWLIDPDLTRRLGTLEAARGVNRAEADIPPDVLAATHRRYAAERDGLIDRDHTGPRPSGGVGGTRVGVKCLHTHYAYWLAGGNDPVAEWANAHSEEWEHHG